MSGGGINIKIHHGGTFSEEGILTYTGGQVSIFRNCDIDRLSYFELVGMAKDIGFNFGAKLYYTVPGYNLENRIDEIHDDRSVSRMLKFAKPNMFLDIYIQHDQLGLTDNARACDQTDNINMHKNNDKKNEGIITTKKRDRRIWSAEEETLLIDLLYEMNGTGWKVDTGHKSGYLTYIEKEMAKKLPNCNLKAGPHIKSKVKVMKKQLTYILEIQQNGSGFGWDDEQKMVTGDKEIFMGWAKSRDGTAPLFMKPMIHYDKLVEIYANDLAKGGKVKGPGEQSDSGEEQFTINTNQVGGQVLNEPQTQDPNTTPINSQQCVKRKSHDVDILEREFIQISKTLSSLIKAEKDSAMAMNDIKRAFVHEVDVHEQTTEKRKQLF
ncbi:hypothetical protein RDABS01_037298 [Bienertia sinuspersici]